MEEYERYETDNLKSSRTYNKHDRNRAKKRSNKDRTLVHNHRYVFNSTVESTKMDRWYS